MYTVKENEFAYFDLYNGERLVASSTHPKPLNDLKDVLERHERYFELRPGPGVAYAY